MCVRERKAVKHTESNRTVVLKSYKPSCCFLSTGVGSKKFDLLPSLLFICV